MMTQRFPTPARPEPTPTSSSRSAVISKQQKLKALLKLLGKTEGKKCLLVTNGDNNGALNWYFREHGGDDGEERRQEPDGE